MICDFLNMVMVASLSEHIIVGMFILLLALLIWRNDRERPYD